MDRDHDHSSQKNIMFLSVYMIATMMRSANMIIDILYLSLYKDFDYNCSPKRALRSWSKFSQNTLFLRFYKDCDQSGSSQNALFISQLSQDSLQA